MRSSGSPLCPQATVNPASALPRSAWFVALGVIAAAALLSGLVLHTTTWFDHRAERETIVLPADQFSHVSGHCYSTRLTSAGPSDATSRSSLLLYEDGRPLPGAHSDHGSIIAQGAGRYSHWHDLLYFSANDAYDPRAGSRVYTASFVRAPEKPQVLAWTLVVVGLLGLVGCALGGDAGREAMRRRVLPTLWVGSLACAVVVLVLTPFGPADVHRTLSDAVRLEHVDGRMYSATFDDPLPTRLTVYEGRRPLPFADWLEDFRETGGGRYRLSPDRTVLYFSSIDGADPLATSQRYRIVGWTAGLPRKTTTVVWLAVCVLTGLLLVWSRVPPRPAGSPRTERLLDLATATLSALFGTSPAWQRAAAAVLVAVGILVALAPSWDTVTFCPDSGSYIDGSLYRPPLYAWIIDRFTSERLDSPNWRQQSIDNPFLPVARFHKLLFAAAATALFVALTSRLNAWVTLGVFFCLGRWEAWLLSIGWLDLTAVAWLDFILTEGINTSLIVLLMAATAAYLARPTWLRGLALPVLLTLLLLNRPANLPLVGVLAAVAMFHLVRDNWLLAVQRTALLAGVLAVGSGAWSLHNWLEWGHFKLQPYTGFNAIGITLQLAEPGDERHFRDPLEREFVRRCLAESATKRLPFEDPNYFNTNAHRIAGPVIRQLFDEQRLSGTGEIWQMDELLTSVAKQLVLLHPWRYAEMVVSQLGIQFEPPLHVPMLVALVLSLGLFVWTRQPTFLLAAILGAVPLAMILPAAMVEYPLYRYRSQTYFCELLSLPVFALAVGGWLATLLAYRRGSREASEPAAADIAPVHRARRRAA